VSTLVMSGSAAILVTMAPTVSAVGSRLGSLARRKRSTTLTICTSSVAWLITGSATANPNIAGENRPVCDRGNSRTQERPETTWPEGHPEDPADPFQRPEDVPTCHSMYRRGGVMDKGQMHGRIGHDQLAVRRLPVQIPFDEPVARNEGCQVWARISVPVALEARPCAADLPVVSSR